MSEDWDLYAVVRSYRTAAATSTNSTTTDTTNPVVAPAAGNTNQEYLGGESSSFANLPDPFRKAADNPYDFSGFISHKESFQGLEEIYSEQQQENAEPYSINTATSWHHQYSPVFEEFQKQQQYTLQPEQASLYPQHSQHIIQPHHQQQQHLHLTLGSSTLSFPCTSSQPIRSRRRKNQQAKMIKRMTQEELSGDLWAWRKYGQKPIKGSPYPRNYYRCSTSKGCIARRQVEQCPTEPHMYVVSYSGEHSHPRPTHRSSLAGSTRTKGSAKPRTSSEPVINPAPTATSMATSSSPASASSFSPRRDSASAAEEGTDAENQNAEVTLGEEEEEGEGWDDVEDDEDDDDDDGDGDGEILIPNTLIDHY